MDVHVTDTIVFKRPDPKQRAWKGTRACFQTGLPRSPWQTRPQATMAQLEEMSRRDAEKDAVVHIDPAGLVFTGILSCLSPSTATARLQATEKKLK